MSFKEFGLLLTAILISVAGQVLLKLGALKLGRIDTTNWLSHILGVLITPELVFGLACYAVGAFAFIFVLTRVDLSIAGPVASLSYVFSVLFGYFFFRETIPPTRIIGLGLIVAGVILVMGRK